MQVRTLSMCHHGRDPNLMMSLVTFTTPSLSLGTPSLHRPSGPTHMRASSQHRHRQIRCACKTLTLTISSTNVLQCCQKLMLLAMAKFLWRVALLTKQTAHPSSQGVYLWLACWWRRTALRTALFQKAPRGGPYFPHYHCRHDLHIIVILLVINIYLF